MFDHFRRVYNGHFIANVDMTQERANRLIAAGTVDSVAFARPYIANPDLAERFLTSAPISEINWPTVYASGPKGYIDYPRLLTTPSNSLPNGNRKNDERNGRNPLANGIAIGMRIALFILVPLGIIAAIAILFLYR
jgi:hypothetical protein